MTLADLQSKIDHMPFQRSQPVRVLACDAATGAVTLALPWRPEYDNGNGAMHGGVLCSLIDTTAAFGVVALRGASGPTLNLRVDFLKAALPGEEVTATALVRRSGRTLAFVDVEARNPAGQLVALGRANYLAAS